MRNNDWHNRDGKLERLLKRIKDSRKISAENKKILFDYHNYTVAEGLSVGRIQKLLTILSKTSIWLKKKFTDATKDDIIRVVQTIGKQNFAESTQCDYKVILKKFYKWLRKTEDHYPEEVRWIKATVRNQSRLLPQDLLTEEEVLKLVEAADTIRNKAFIFVLYESGCRIGEIASLKLKNVQFVEPGAILFVSGKTGDRRIRIISSSSYLARWIDTHPDRNNPEASLWVGLGPRNKNNQVTYNDLNMVIKKVANKIGLKKKVNPHVFRHSRATFLAKHLTEAQLKQIFGWTQSSDMASVYVHLSGRDTDEAILKLHGFMKEEETETKLKPKICPLCKFVNSPTDRLCHRCARIIDPEAYIKLEERRGTEDDWLAKILKDSAVQNTIIKRAIVLGIGDEIVGAVKNRRR